MYIILGFILEIVVLFTYFYYSTHVKVDAFNISYLNPLSPLTFIVAILIFNGFSKLNISNSKVANIISYYSLYIYLWHAMVNELLFGLIRKQIITANFIVIILGGTIFILIISLVLSKFTKKIYYSIFDLLERRKKKL